ncbi:MAG: cyclase family protein [Clostridiales bacterium]|nr:cyclase family protein [Clostridiales bacterium]
MKIYDISQEVFGCKVFPGDPKPEKKAIMKISDGDVCNLTEFKMCAHNGTHVDAPFHFIDGEETVDQVPLDKFIGYAYVAEHEGLLGREDAERILAEAKDCGMILVKGDSVMTEEGAKIFADAKIKLYGNESQTVGPEDAPMAVHLIMLGAKIVLLEGIRLAEVPVGSYLLDAAPINLGGCDGAPCRAVLIKNE